MKTLSKYSLLISTLVLCGLMFCFILNLNDRFEKVNEAYDEKNETAVNLSPKMKTDVLKKILLSNGYVKDAKDADFIANTLKERLKEKEFPYLYVLQKRDYGKVSAREAEKAGVLTERLRVSCEQLEQDHIPNLDLLDNTANLNSSGGTINVKIVPDKNNVESCKDVVVRLRVHFYDKDKNAVKRDTLFVKTDENGCASFTGLDKSLAYSVLPIKKYYEYGQEKGIVEGKFKKDSYEIEFTQLEHRIPMFNDATLKQIKYDGTITVRTPDEFLKAAIPWFAAVILAWWILALILIRRRKNFDPLIVATAMFLTGLCVLMMFAIQNPLTEELRGIEMAQGVIIGVVIVAVFQYIDFIKLYQHRYKLDFDIPLAVVNWFFLPFKRKVAWLASTMKGYGRWYGKIVALVLVAIVFVSFIWLDLLRITKLSKYIERAFVKLPRGIGWFFMAIILTAMMFIPAFAGIVGGMRVNLKLGPLTFQPSEITKYLMLFFMAAFFTQQADAIIQYSDSGSKRFVKKLKLLGIVIASVGLLMALYAVLGDMGPALVVCVTFILLYSLVKSKVNLENLNETDKWKRILTCDFAILIYGVLSFAAFLIGGYLLGKTVDIAIIAGLLWFVLWILFGWARKRQFFETAFITNLLIFMFVFGGQTMKNIDAFKDSPMAERFDQRAKMCVNTWGDLDEEHQGAYSEPVSNTQVANGLWAISTGGFSGQGLGKGNANLIPAFHTDMILSSIAEQIGWLGLLAVVLVLALLLRRIVVLGYKAGHPFAFYFCMGVAIVTGVQFFVIALGSSGMIPLTGITVPLLSYGRVSMILNIAALGVILSFGGNINRKEEDVEVEMRKRGVGDYNYPVSIVSWTFVVLAVFTLGVWYHYAIWDRDNTLVKPAYVHNKQGVPLVEYNPRIALLTKEMYAGDILDRNNVILATSYKEKINDTIYSNYGLDINGIDSILVSHSKRYYPFGEQTFFMVGDMNTGLYFYFDENNPKSYPVGYMAEAQHLSTLRGYDNIKYDKNNNPIEIHFSEDVDSEDYFLSLKTNYSKTEIIRDYSKLIPYLKDGIYGDLVKKHNENIKKGDLSINLTVDAVLQTQINNKLKEFVGSNKKYYDNNLLRISVVVLDAENGDMLSSSCYPLPDYQRLKDEYKDGNDSYIDKNRDENWPAYTNRDLGLTFQTPPGSTAKVMSSLAAFNRLGVKGVRNDAIFEINRFDVIDFKDKIDKMNPEKNYSLEPPKKDGAVASVGMKEAIVVSSNCYFIRLVNEFDLYPELNDIYSKAGITLNYNRSYLFDYKLMKSLDKEVENQQKKAIKSYDRYLKNRVDFKNNKDWQKLKIDDLMWAWGQGTMDASPLNMARVVSAVINEGEMPVTRFLITDTKRNEKMTEPDCANELKGYMNEQAHDRTQTFIRDAKFPQNVGGKTGTPMRDFGKKESQKDGWYVFYIDNKDAGRPSLAVAIRMERVGYIKEKYKDLSGSSGDAVKLASNLMPLLEEYDCTIKVK